jgi:hypothetical protein
VASLVILNTHSPSKLSDDLILYGCQVWEALDVSEVLFLGEQHRVDVVIATAQVVNPLSRRIRRPANLIPSSLECRCWTWVSRDSNLPESPENASGSDPCLMPLGSPIFRGDVGQAFPPADI